MREEDQPAEHLWLDDDAIREHFERVKERWAAGASGMEPIEDPGSMEQNETTKHLRRLRR